MQQKTTALPQKIYRDLLLNITNTMLNTVNQTDFFAKVLQYIGQDTQASRVYVFERSEEGLWSNTFEWCSKNTLPMIDSLQNFDEQVTVSVFFQHLLTGEPYIYDDIELIHDKDTYELFKKQNILSIFAAPLYKNNSVSGFFGFDMCEKYTVWQPETINTHISIANLLSSAIGHFHVKKELEHKTSEFQKILDAFPDPIYISDMDTHEILFCNLHTRQLSPKAATAEVPCYKALQDLDEPCSFCTNDALRTASKPITWINYHLPTKRTFRVLDCCIEWQGRKKVRLSAAQDITDLLEAKKNEVLANEANLAKNTFLSNISHELRTPLGNISGLLHLTREHYNNPAILETYLKKIQASTFTLHTLVNNVLDYTQIESKTLKLDIAPFNICTIMQNIADTFTPIANEKNLFFHYHLDDTLPQTVLGDAFRLSQILINLLNNAIKFTSKGGVTLSCHLQERVAPQVTMEIQIQDTGIGLNETECASLFDIFNQADNSLTRGYGGAGVGLAIVSKLVKLMDGNITCKSVYDAGATFILTIPFTETISHPLEQEEQSISKTQSLQGVRILVAEDNLINQIIAREILESAGSFVDIANNGEEAMNMADRTSYDIVLMDIQMPIMDGITATKYIRQTQTGLQLPIIALTAHSQKDDKENSLKTGMQDHVTKPINPEELLSTLLKWVKKRT